MARLRYGGSSGDFVINVSNGRPMAYHVVTVHTERTGGTQVTDLLDINSNPVTSVTADGFGLVAFYGPDGTHETLWLDTGTGARLACIAMEYAPTGAFAQTDLANTFTFDQEIEKANPTFKINAASAGQAGTIELLTNDSLRWRVLKNTTAEAGSHAGSDLVIQAYNDSGSSIGSALTITRSTMASTFGGSVITPASTTSAASFRVPHGTAPTSPVNGDIWSTTGGMFVRINGTSVSLTVDEEQTLSRLRGAITAYAGTSIPSGFLLCNGAAVSRTTYAALFAIIGTAYGAGDGTTTFNLPDLRGRVPVGVDNMGGSDAGRLSSANTLGTAGGAETHTLSAAETPSHTHPFSATTSTDGAHTHSTKGEDGDGIAGSANTYHVSGSGAQTGASAGSHSHTVSGTTGSAGSGGAHNNMQPFITLNYIIKF